MNKLIEAHNKGYRVNSDGIPIGINNNPIKPLLQNGYYKINIRIDNKHYGIRVHRLQAFQKFGNKLFKEGICVRHLDGNPLNNSIDNIEIGTQSDNMMDIPKEIRKAKAEFAASHNILFDHNKVIDFYNQVKSYKKTMEHFNIKSKSTLHNIINKHNIEQL